MTTAPTKPPIPMRMPTLAKPAPPAAKPAAPAKTFTVQEWTNEGQGEKIIIYGKSGNGKTTLATMAPDPIFIGVDDGARKIRNPKTGKPVRAIQGIETFKDVRDALHQENLFPAGCSIVIDTITAVQKLAEAYTMETVKVSGSTPKSLEEYGYGKGYRYLCETMRLLYADLDSHMRRGCNILLLAQDAPHKVPNLAGLDYLEAGPELDWHGSPNAGGECCQWADHIFRIDHPPVQVRVENPQAKKGKVSGSTERMIYTKGDLHFIAKNRLPGLPEVVSFSAPDDNALWQFVFEGAKASE